MGDALLGEVSGGGDQERAVADGHVAHHRAQSGIPAGFPGSPSWTGAVRLRVERSSPENASAPVARGYVRTITNTFTIFKRTNLARQPHIGTLLVYYALRWAFDFL
ncbi:hypothetical protein GCM10022419_031840 [Nonomuraea rosea]|uniref:Transposase n=1 Tax=Nonomuraea rosea TaxID=638574 RepID=A0ABP6WDK8_9ACTN